MKKKKLLAGLLIIGSTCLGMADNSKNEALIRAATFGEYNAVKRLLDAGADVNAVGQYGGTALMGAAGMGHDKIIELLLSKGAKIDQVDDRGMTALMKAAAHTFSTIDLLMEKGADKAIKDKRGYSAYTYATSNSQRLKP